MKYFKLKWVDFMETLFSRPLFSGVQTSNKRGNAKTKSRLLFLILQWSKNTILWENLQQALYHRWLVAYLFKINIAYKDNWDQSKENQRAVLEMSSLHFPCQNGGFSCRLINWIKQKQRNTVTNKHPHQPSPRPPYQLPSADTTRTCSVLLENFECLSSSRIHRSWLGR